MLQLPQPNATRAPKLTAIAREYRNLEVLFASWLAKQTGPAEDFNRTHDRLMKLACKIIAMPASNQADILMKIAAAGPLVNYKNWDQPLTKWEADPTGYFCDDAAPLLLMGIRRDLHHLMELS
jgi:hypothetical protein